MGLNLDQSDVTVRCRSCDRESHALVLDLGIQPLANNLLRPEDLQQPEPRFPLRLAVCPFCWLLQLVDLIPPVNLFSEYLYFSSFSDALLRHAQAAAEQYVHRFSLDSHSLVVEIASNDGYLLRNFVAHHIPCLGIEPAANIAKVASNQGIPTLVEFFDLAMAKRLAREGRQADLILGNNVFAHVPTTNDFVAGLHTLLKPKGRIVLEFPYAVEMIEKGEFDTIYHEHVFYYTLTALLPLFQRHGLSVFRVERLPIHGGSLRLFVCHREAYPVEPSVTAMLMEEDKKGVSSLGYYATFRERAAETKRALTALCSQLNAQGKRLAAYGASAKGSTLLNFAGLGRELLGFVADRSTYKQGRLTPGTHIPIVEPGELVKQRPDYALLLTWNFAEEILAQQQAYRDLGGKFIIPIPEVSIV